MELGLSPRWDAAQREEDEDEWKWAVFDMTPGLAHAIGVSPLSAGPGTPMRDTGLLALTPYGLAGEVPPGSYRI